MDNNKWLVDLKNPRDWRVREQAVLELGVAKSPEAMSAIASALYDESPHVVRTAAQTLIPFGSKAVPPLIQVLEELGEKENANPHEVVHSLKEISDKRAVPILLKLLTHPDQTIRHSAVAALGAMQISDAVPTFINMMPEEPPYLQQLLAEVLGSFKSQEAIDALQPLLHSDDKVTCRYTAIALGKIGTEKSLQILLQAAHHAVEDVRVASCNGLRYFDNNPSFEQLLTLLKDSSKTVRTSAIDALSRQRRPEATAYLIELFNDPDPAFINSLMYSIGHTGDLEVVPYLIERLGTERHNHGYSLHILAETYWKFDENPEGQTLKALAALQSDNQSLRISAAWLLNAYAGHIRHELLGWTQMDNPPEDFIFPDLYYRVVNQQIELLSDPNPDIRLSVIDSVWRAKDMKAVLPIAQCLEHSNLLLAAKAAEALAHLPSPQAIPYLLTAIERNDSRLRNRVMSALSTIGGSQAFSALVSLLNHSDAWTRGAAAFDLGKMRNFDATPHLLRRLSVESDHSVRKWIIIGLGYVSDTRATETLIRILLAVGDQPSNTKDARYEAAQALGRLVDLVSIPALYEAINSAPESLVKVFCVQALSNFGDERQQADRMLELLAHQTSEVRAEASRKLGYIGKAANSLALRDYVVEHLIARLTDKGYGTHYAVPFVAHEAARSLHYIGTTEAIAALKVWDRGKDLIVQNDDDL